DPPYVPKELVRGHSLETSAYFFVGTRGVVVTGVGSSAGGRGRRIASRCSNGLGKTKRKKGSGTVRSGGDRARAIAIDGSTVGSSRLGRSNTFCARIGNGIG